MKLLLIGLFLSLCTSVFAEEAEQIDISDLKSSAELTLELDLEDLDVDAELDAEAEARAAVESGTLSFGGEMRPPRRGRPRPPRYTPPRRGRPMPPRHRPRPPHREVVCVAENGRGDRFRAYDYRPHRAEMKALRRCERNSYRPRSCWVIGCRRSRLAIGW